MVHCMILYEVVTCTYVPVFGILVPEALNITPSRMQNIATFVAQDSVCSIHRFQYT